MRGSAHGRLPWPGSPAIFTVWKLGGAAEAVAANAAKQPRTAATKIRVPLPRRIASGRGLYAGCSADAPRQRIRLRGERDAVGGPDELRLAGRDALPEDLLDVVDPVELVGRAHVAVALAAVRCDHAEVEIVLERGAGWVAPHERDLQGGGGHPALARDVDLGRLLLALLERGPLPEAGVRVVARDDHGAGEVDPPPARVVVRRGSGLGRRVLTLHLHGAVDEERLEQCGARRVGAVLHQRLAQDRHAARDEWRGHARAAVEEVEGIARLAEVGRGLRVARERREDARAGRDDVRLDALLLRRPAAAEGHEAVRNRWPGGRRRPGRPGSQSASTCCTSVGT